MDALNFGALDEPENEIYAVMRYHEISSLGSKFGTKPSVNYAGWNTEKDPFQ
jgi:Fe-S-cluster-containing dehydrogenase component